jgi:hypothetical protein
MSVFKKIDEKLENLALNLSATLSKNRPYLPAFLNTFEERRIDWQEDNIKKAIIIQPMLEPNGVDESFWNYCIMAWIEVDGIPAKFFKEQLMSKIAFIEIEREIEKLIELSMNKLIQITDKDLNQII